MGEGPTVELTVLSGGATETYTVKVHSPGRHATIQALAAVCAAGFGAHRAELADARDMIANVARMVGYDPPKPHGIANCGDTQCPWHRDRPAEVTPHNADECNSTQCPWHTTPWYRGHAGGQQCTDMNCAQTPHYALEEPPF